MIEFKRDVEKTSMIDAAGKRIEQTIEHRTDPLSGTVASINSVLGEKARAFLGSADVDLIRDLQEKSRIGCPFCSAGEKGTRFVPEFLTQGQLVVGNSIAMPNLFSKCSYDSVVIINHTLHTLFPSEIPSADISSAIRAAVEIIRRSRSGDPSLVHHVLGMNFLNPGGSSVPHPHFQVHVRGIPYSGVVRTMAQSGEFFRRNGKNYWDLLVEREKGEGSRYIGKTGSVEWLAAYAPYHQKEIWGVLPGVGSLAELTDSGAESFGAGISRVIGFYESMGSHPFTLAFFSSPREGMGGSYALHVKLCARPAFKQLYANYDTWFTPLYIGDEVHTEAPEQYARGLREYFQGIA